MEGRKMKIDLRIEDLRKIVEEAESAVKEYDGSEVLCDIPCLSLNYNEETEEIDIDFICVRFAICWGIRPPS